MGQIQGSKASSLYPLLRSMRAVTQVFSPHLTVRALYRVLDDVSGPCGSDFIE